MRRCLDSGTPGDPSHRELVTELVTREQRPTPSGGSRIAAPGGSHDDYATALLALVNELEAPTEPGILGVYRKLYPSGAVAERPPTAGGAWRLSQYERASDDPIPGRTVIAATCRA